MALVVLAAIGACSWADGEAGTSTAPPSSDTSAAPTTTTTPLPPPWEPGPGEPEPELKRVAARAVQVFATYGPGGGTMEATRARLVTAGLEPLLADGVGAVLHSSAAGSVEIVYPQLGGLSGTEASVMVVASLTVDDATRTRTFDVRAARTPAGWRATAIVSVGGADPDVEAPPAAAALLENDRVVLPDSARWDLEAGLVDTRIVDVLTVLSASYELSVTVFGTGHPANVFGTVRMSNHTAGRGVDIWAVNGATVATQRDAPLLRTLVDEARSLGITEIGAPFDVDGVGGIVFTNTVHLDHLHLAFKR